MVEIKKITPKALKNAQKILGCMEIIGVTQEELQLIKEIPTMQREIAELLEFKNSINRQATETFSANQNKNYADLVKTFKETEEFTPYGRE